MAEKKRRVLVFGVFDCFHDGHTWFLDSAKKQGDELIVVVARDSVVRALKGKAPRDSEELRLTAVGEYRAVDHAVFGDEEQGRYDVLKEWKPEVICLGYDQDALARDIEEKMVRGELPQISIIRIPAYQPEKFHTSLLRGDTVQ